MAWTDHKVVRVSPIILEAGAAAIGLLCVLSTVRFCLNIDDTVLLVFAIIFSISGLLVTMCGRGGRMEAASVVAPLAGVACYAGAAKLCDDFDPVNSNQTIIVYSASAMLALATLLRFARTVDLCCKRRHEKSIEEKPLVEQTEAKQARSKANGKKSLSLWGRSSSKKPDADSPSATTSAASGFAADPNAPPPRSLSPKQPPAAASDSDNPFGFERDEPFSGGGASGAYGSSREPKWAPRPTRNYGGGGANGGGEANSSAAAAAPDDNPWGKNADSRRSGAGAGAYGGV